MKRPAGATHELKAFSVFFLPDFLQETPNGFMYWDSRSPSPALRHWADCMGEMGSIVGEFYEKVQTEREKAINDMLEEDLWATDREFCSALYDLGYRKCDTSSS